MTAIRKRILSGCASENIKNGIADLVLYLSFAAVLYFACGKAAWGQDNPPSSRVLVSEASEEALSPLVLSLGEGVCVVWSQFDGTFYRLISRIWNGSQWSVPAWIGDGSANANYPVGVISNGTLLVAWIENHGPGSGLVRFMRSIDQGLSWQPSLVVSGGPPGVTGVSIAAWGNVVYLVWADTSSGIMTLRYRVSLDRGVTWGLEKSLASSNQDCRHPTVSTSGSQVQVAWEDWRHGQPEIYYRRSLNQGESWSNPVPLSVLDSFASEHPTMACNGQVICLVWQEDTLTNPALMIIRSTNGGSSWTRTKLAEGDGAIVSPALSATGNDMYLGFIEGGYPMSYLQILASPDSGLSWSTFDTYSPDQPAWLGLPSLGAAGGIFHAAWSEHFTGGFGILMSRLPPFASPAAPLLLIY